MLHYRVPVSGLLEAFLATVPVRVSVECSYTCLGCRIGEFGVSVARDGAQTPDANPPVTVSAVTLGQARRGGKSFYCRNFAGSTETRLSSSINFQAIGEQEDHQSNPTLTFAAGT